MVLPEGLEEFSRREHPRLVGALSLYCGDADVAEELAQAALERACERWHQVSSMPTPGAWLHRVAINMANSLFRRRAAERRAHARSGTVQSHEDADVADAVAVRQALSTLPRRQRSVLVARFYLGFDVAQTAEVLGMTPNAVKASTHRALSRLRDVFIVADEEEQVDAR